MACSSGVIKNINEDNYTIQHLCDSSRGSSGGPLINSQNYQVIGIHKGRAEGTKNYNLGTLLKEPIKLFNELSQRKKESNQVNINKNEYIKENEDKKSEVIIIDKNENKEEKAQNNENLTLKEQVKKSVCEIIKEDGYGLGFFCKIIFEENEICCLFSNNHVISDQMISNEDRLAIKLNNKIFKILLKVKRRIWTNKNLDFTCIEIIEEDNFLSNIGTFEIDKNNYNVGYNLEKYDKRKIIVVPLKEIGDIELSRGEIDYEKNNKERFFHNCYENGLTGGPIILISNSSIVGINCWIEKNIKKDKGIYFKEIIENMKKKIIKCLIDVKLNKDKEEILLFNQNVKYKNIHLLLFY